MFHRPCIAKGYNYLPHNIRDTGNIKVIRDYVEDGGNVFICPTTEDSDKIIKLDPDGMFRVKPIDDEDVDSHIAFKNNNVIVGTFRKGENTKLNFWPWRGEGLKFLQEKKSL